MVFIRQKKPRVCPRLVCTLALVCSQMLFGCGDNSTSTDSTSTVSIDEFCERLVLNTCERGLRCENTELPATQAACIVEVTNSFDGCPMLVDAVGRSETIYDPLVGTEALANAKNADCQDSAATVNQPIEASFSALLSEGEQCHSKASCKGELECLGLTVTTPEGVCGVEDLD